MRLIVVVVAVSACMPVRLAQQDAQQNAQAFPAEAATATGVDAGSFERALQRLVAEGFAIQSATKSSGLLVAERTAVDSDYTAKKADRWVGGTPPTFARRLTLTVAFGETSATVSPRVLSCRQVREDVSCRPEILKELTAEEADLMGRLLAAISAPAPR